MCWICNNVFSDKTATNLKSTALVVWIEHMVLLNLREILLHLLIQDGHIV